MSYYQKRGRRCSHCRTSIPPNVFSFSKSNFGIPLCIPCQNEFKLKAQKATPEALELYLELRKRGVRAELEKWDGYKTIDIAVVDAKVNIEVDGMQHNYHPGQALSDLKRTLFSFQKGYLTLRIPNSLIRTNLKETTEHIVDFLDESMLQLEEWDELDEFEDF